MFNQYKSKYLIGKGTGNAFKNSALAKISLTAVVTTMLLLAANAWYAPQKWNLFGNSSIADQVVISSKGSTTLCVGGETLLLSEILITEGEKDDFIYDVAQTNAKTLTLTLDDENFVFDKSKIPTVTFSANASPPNNTPLNITMDDHTLSFDYKFEDHSVGASSPTNSLSITGLYVKALGSATSNAHIRVKSGAEMIDGLEGESSADANDGTIIGDVNLHPILGSVSNISTPKDNAGTTTLNEGESITFSTPEVANANKYLWHVPAELNGGAIEIKETNTPQIELKAVQTSVPLATQIKVQAISDNCSGGFSSDYLVNIQPTGLSITAATISDFCKTTSSQSLSELVITENSNTDFQGQGTLKLDISDDKFQIKGAPTIKVNEQNDVVGFSVSRSNKTLTIEYDFTQASFDSQLDKIEITGIQIKPTTNAVASTVSLHPRSVDGLQWTGVYLNTVFGIATMVDKPTIATGIVVLPQPTADSYKLVAQGIKNATSYEWVLPNNDIIATSTTTNSPEIIINDTRADKTLGIDIKVKGVNNCGDGDEFTKSAIVLINKFKVYGLPLADLCVGGDAKLIKSIYCTETVNDAFANGLVELELSQPGFELLVAPTVTFNNEAPLSNVTLSNDKRKISFNITNNDAALDQIVITGLSVRATLATPTNQQVFLRTTSLSSTGEQINLVSISRLEPLASPEFIAFPTLACANTSNVTLSVKPQLGVVYEWSLPNGVNILSQSIDKSKLNVELANNFTGGDVTVSAVSVNSNTCKTTSTPKTFVTPATPTQAVVITGKEKLFVGEKATYTAWGIQNADKYEWNIPAGLKRADGDVSNITTTNTIELVAETAGQTQPLAVVGVNGCDVKGIVANAGAGVEIVGSKITFEPVTLENVCTGNDNTKQLNVTIKEGFYKDFKGSGTLTLTPKGSLFTLENNAQLNVNLVDVENTQVSAEVVNGELKIDYDFTQDDANNPGKLTIESVQIKFSGSNSNASTKLEFNVAQSNNAEPLNFATEKVFATIASVVAFSTDNAQVTASHQTLCQSSNETYTFSVSGITGADKYEWTLPNELSIVGDQDKSTITVELSNTATDVKNAIVKVRGVSNNNNACKSAIVSASPVQIVTNFGSSVVPSFNSPPASICNIDNELKVVEVNKIAGATQYEWELDPSLATDTNDEDGDPNNGILTTTSNQIVVKVKVGTVGNPQAKIKVRGIKAGSCSNIATSQEEHPIKVYAPELTINIADGTAYTINADPVFLSGTPSTGTFSGKGVSNNRFIPGSAGTGKHTITYSYEDPTSGCTFSKQITVNVTQFITGCLNPDGTFTLKVKQGLNQRLYGLLNNGQIISDASNLTANIVSGEVVNHISSCAEVNPSPFPITDDLEYKYKFVGAIPTTRQSLNAIFITSIGQSCSRVEMAPIDIYVKPSVPVITSAPVVLCQDRETSYKVDNYNPDYEYTWSVDDNTIAAITTTPNDPDNEDDKGQIVTIKGLTPGKVKLRVTANEKNANSCSTPSANNFEITIREPFMVDIEEKASICNNTNGVSKTYVPKLTQKDNNGNIVDINDLTGYTFQWQFTSVGKSTPDVRVGSEVKYDWGTASGAGTVKLEAIAPNDAQICGVTKDFEFTVTDFSIPEVKAIDGDKNKRTVCQDEVVEYELKNANNLDRVTWTVQGGQLLEDDGSVINGNTVSNKSTVKIRWNTSGAQTIGITKKADVVKKGETVLNCSVQETVTVQVNPKPALSFASNISTYCNGDASIWLLPVITDGVALSTAQIKAKITNGEIKFYETKTVDGKEVADLSAEFANPFVPSVISQNKSSYSVVYQYTSTKNCTYTSPVRSFSLENPPQVDFDMSVAINSQIKLKQLNEDDGQGNTIEVTQLCSEDALDNSAIILTPKIKDGNGSIDPTKDFVWEIKKDNKTIKAIDKVAIAPLTYEDLTAVGGGDFTVTYSYYIDKVNDCKAIETKRLRVVMPATLNVGVKDAPASFCINDKTEYELTKLGFASDASEIGGFKIKRLSGDKFNANEDFKDLPNGKFNPYNPMPNEVAPADDASIDVKNENAGRYAIKYVYNYNGVDCAFESDLLTITINPLPKLSIEGLGNEYCNNSGNISFNVFDEVKDVNGITTKALVVPQLIYEDSPNKWKQVLNNDIVGLGVGTHKIKAVHTNNAGCRDSSETRTVTIAPQPSQLKVLINKVYHENQIHFTASAGNISANGSWEWNINGTVKQEQTPVIINNTEATSNINYSLTANTGKCDITIKKGFQLDFGFEGYCAQSPSTLTNKSVIRNEKGEDEIGQVIWTIADKDGNVIDKLSNEVTNYTFVTPGEYWITLTLVNKEGNITYELKRRVDILQVITVLQTANYIENFDNQPEGWVSRGIVNPNGQPTDKTSWRMKTLSNSANDIIKNGEGTVWITDNGGTTHYYDKEQSYVETPCFDISDLDKPMVSLRYWSHTDVGNEGVVLLYSIDDGKTWGRVGKKTPEIEGWYNAQGIVGAPGNASDVNANVENQGWTGTDTTWRNTAYSLSSVRQQMLQQSTNRVRFRIAFGSNSDTPDGQFEGFAFDNFSISNRNRTLLLEYFTNYEASNGKDNTAELDKEVREFPYGKDNPEIISIHHHVGFPAIDELNLANKKDVSGRAFFHGIKEVPMAVIDGKDTSKTPRNAVSELFYDQRVLDVSPFNITIEPASVNNNMMTVKAKVTALENFDRPVVMQVVIIEDEVESQGKTYHNVSRKMLPDAAGTYYNHRWKPRDSYDINLSWEMGDLKMNSFRVVVFIEDYLTKEIHQAAVNQTQTLRQNEGQAGNGVTGVDQRIVKSGMLLFPNPAHDEVELKLNPSQQLKSNAAWEISTINGQTIGSGVWQQHQRSKRIKVGHLAEGVYLLRVFDTDKIFLLRFKKK